VPEGSETSFEDFMKGMKAAGIELPVQDLDELAQSAVAGIRNGDFVIMLGREAIQPQLGERAAKLAAGRNPTGVIPGL
jgi:hypothetical protein